MAYRDEIQIDLVKLSNGERLLRLTESQSGLALEKKLSPKESVVRRKKTLLRAFEAVLTRLTNP